MVNFSILILLLLSTISIDSVAGRNLISKRSRAKDKLSRKSHKTVDRPGKYLRSVNSSSNFPQNSVSKNSIHKIKLTVDHDVYIPEGFNKTIYLMWFTGFDNAPSIVKACSQSWAYYNPRWTIVRLDNATLTQYIPAVTLKQAIPNQATMNPAHVADIIRLLLLERYDGIWADATTFCNRPLDDWLYGNITNGFFAFSRPSPVITLSNWFLYGSRNNYIIRTWRKATMEYDASNPSTTRYYIQHELFQHFVQTDPKFRNMWNSVPFVSADIRGPHFMQQQGFYNNVTEIVKKHVESKQTPVYKLSWKLYVEANLTGHSNLEYLFRTIDISNLLKLNAT